MKILGLSGSTHDSAAALVVDGKIVSAIEEERICKIKKATGKLPIGAAKSCLEIAGINPENIDEVAYFVDPEICKRENPSHVFSDWRRYVLHWRAYRTQRFLNRGERYESEARQLVENIGINAPIRFIRHHFAHAAATFHLSPFKEAMILTIDNMGEIESTMMAVGSGKDIRQISSQKIPHSLGMMYAAITDYLGFTPWFDEGKTMALAALGEPTIPLEEMVEFGDGRFEVKRPYQMVETLAHDRLYSDALVKRLGLPRRKNEPITERHRNIAASAQNALEEVCKHLVTWMHKKTGLRKLCLGGGVALNCKMNGELLGLPFIDEIYVFPAAGDSGASLGAAVCAFVEHAGARPQPLKYAGLGNGFTNVQVENALKNSGVQYEFVDDPAKAACEYLLKEGVIAWFQGRSEFGPRALGHRSILALPNKPGIRDYINEHVKGRELWRPLCPSVLGSKAERYFPRSSQSTFMNVTHRGIDGLQQELPEIFHSDGTARVQAVYDEESPIYKRLLEMVGKENGYPILINTSFNVKGGNPMVDSPEDAITHFNQMPIKTMIIENYIVRK